MQPEDRYARAVELARAYREEPGAVLLEQFLGHHEDLRDLLEILLDDDDDSLPPTAPSLPRSAAPQAAPDQRFGRFRLMRALGQGGMGTVYLAFDTDLDRPVALKQIRPELLHFGDTVRRFEREARAVSRLAHPNLCRVYEGGEHDGVPYLVMEYLEGTTLAERIEAARGESTPPSSRDEIRATIETIEKVARALHCAHESGLVHRDVKPQNLIIKPDGEPVVMDFGLVRDESGADLTLTGTGQILGTPLYMAPEQVVPTGRAVDRRADVYAVGATLFEWLTLTRPFEAPTRHELFTKILREPPPDPAKLNPRVPRDLGVVVQTALDKDPERRYRTAEELAEDLRRVREHQPIRARPPGIGLRAWRWTQRNPVVATFLAMITVGLVVSTSLFVEAAQANERYELLSYVEELKEIEDRVGDLYPAWPNSTPRIESWIADAERLAERLPELRSVNAYLQHSSGVSELLRREIPELVTDLEGLVDADTGALASVRRSLAWARTVRTKTIAEHGASWRRAITAIQGADGVEASALYARCPFELTPQLGLVPLGADPDSLLWEFWHVRSGAPPAFDTEAGRYQITGETGVVFVLLPGGTFTMGAQAVDPAGVSFDPGSMVNGRTDEGPPHEVSLAPFFVGKYELTQGQWARLSGGEWPSQYPPGYAGLPNEITAANPVEMVSWDRARAVLGRHGLELPTEAQWEYACRAGTATPWYTGTREDTLEGHGNLADQTVIPWGGDTRSVVPWNDGYLVHAPVGACPPNRFGLHDMLGNVSELCLDGFEFWAYERDWEPVTGLRRTGPCVEIAVRGGCYLFPAAYARSADRQKITPGDGGNQIGVRPIRPILPADHTGDPSVR